MPLIRNGHIQDGYYVLDAAAMQALNKKDCVRHVVNGLDTSMRNDVYKGGRIHAKSALYESAKQLAEVGVTVIDTHIDLLEQAVESSVRMLNKVFKKASCVGVDAVPGKFAKLSGLSRMSSCVIIEFLPGIAWYPTAAKIVNGQIFIVFRVWDSAKGSKELSFIKTEDTALICLAAKDLESYSPDLAAYINKLRTIADRDEGVVMAYELFMKEVRPDEYFKKEQRKMLARYDSVESFGMWG
jgi:hypothetical protein